jgi:hypothetical protein
MKHLAAVLLCLLLAATPACADLPIVRLDRLIPLGGAAGTTVDLEIAGADLEGVNTLRLTAEGQPCKVMPLYFF